MITFEYAVEWIEKSQALSQKEKVLLIEYVKTNPEGREWIVAVIQEEMKNREENKKKYLQNIISSVESYILACKDLDESKKQKIRNKAKILIENIRQQESIEHQHTEHEVEELLWSI